MSDTPVPIVEHLEEARRRIIAVSVLLFIFTACAFSFSDLLLDYIMRDHGTLVFIAPQEALMSRLLISFMCGIIAGSPFILWQLWVFIAGAMTPGERRFMAAYGIASYLLFILGVLFGYYTAAPVAFRFFLSFQTTHLVPMISVSRYISFIASLSIGLGVVFELPVVVCFLSARGLATPLQLSARRREVAVSVFILAAIMTPPDVITQCLLAVPLIALYEISIMCARGIYRRKNARK